MTATTVPYFVQQILNSVPLAALYAMLAFGYSMSFGLTKRADFTPGALFAFAGQIFVFFTAFGWDRLLLVYPLALGLGASVALAYTLLAAVIVSKRVTMPLSFYSPNSVIAASLGVMIVLMELVRVASGSHDVWLSPFLNTHVVFWRPPGFPVMLTALQISNALLMTIIVMGSWAWLKWSAAGRIWRAVSDDPHAAAICGIDAGQVLVLSAMATAVYSALSGILATSYYGSMDFGSGLMFGLKVVMIAAIGDQSAPHRSAIGAAVFGVAETLWGAYMPFLWRDFAMFSMLVILAVIVRQERRL
jgi:branched-chain amino acid transport system permease protein